MGKRGRRLFHGLHLTSSGGFSFRSIRGLGGSPAVIGMGSRRSWSLCREWKLDFKGISLNFGGLGCCSVRLTRSTQIQLPNARIQLNLLWERSLSPRAVMFNT